MNASPSLSVLDHVSVWAMNVGLQATILTATALLCAALLRRVPVTRYWVLCCSLILLLCSPILATWQQYTGSGWIVFSAPNNRASNSNAVPQPATTNALTRFAQPLLDVKQPIDVAGKTHDVTDEVSSTTIAADTPSQEFVSGTSASATSGLVIQWIPSWLRIAAALSLVVWGIGAGVLLTRMLVGWVRMSRILRQAQPVANQELIRLFEKACVDAGIKRNRMPRLTVSDGVSGPIAAGLRLGTVVLPSKLVRHLSPCELSGIFVHEVAHIVRRDQVSVLLQNFVSAIFWPHPLVSKLNRELAKAREEVCDNFVLATLPATAYSRTLLSLAEAFRRPQQLPGSVGFFSSNWKLEQRVAGLLDDRRGRRTKLRKRDRAFVFGIAMSLAALMCVATISISGAQSQDAGTAQNSGKKTVPPTNTAPSTPNAIATNVQSEAKTASAEQRYYVTGTVREAVTNQPIAGAEVQLLVSSEQLQEKRVPKGISDANGKYRIEVPMGSVKLWFPSLKPGYWLAPKDAMKDLVTSPEQPEAVHDIIANKSPTWRVHAIGELGEKPILAAMEEPDPVKRAALIKGEKVTWSKFPVQTHSYADANGRGTLTQVGHSGGLFIGVVNVSAELVVDEGFDNTRVVSAERLPGSTITKMIDQSGKQATVTEATVTLENGSPLLTFQLKSSPPVAMQKLLGRVADDSGKPLPGTRVGIACGRKNAGSSVRPEHTLTDNEGRFELKVPIKESTNDRMGFSAIVTRDGYASMDTQHIDCTKDFLDIDFGTIKLAKGHSLPVQVVDANGKAVAGANVEPGNDYSLRSQAVRSDASGRAVLRNLPTGVVRVTTTHGNLVVQSKLVVSEDESENTETKIKLAEMRSPKPGGEPPKPIAIGATGPDWELQGWSDGKERRIADYRGQVLVLDFWGTWCGPCVQAIPSMQALAEKYEAKGVVFLGIHTPDGEFDQIAKLKKLHGWSAPSAIDRGTSIADGTTSTAYGIHAYPSIVIIGRDGKVAYNSGIEPKDRNAFMQEMNELAKESGIAWPPNENTPLSEQEQSMSQFMQLMLGREIERVLQ